MGGHDITRAHQISQLLVCTISCPGVELLKSTPKIQPQSTTPRVLPAEKTNQEYLPIHSYVRKKKISQLYTSDFELFTVTSMYKTFRTVPGVHSTMFEAYCNKARIRGGLCSTLVSTLNTNRIMRFPILTHFKSAHFVCRL